jgi:ABC-type sugar transport system ATPase subunit
VSKAFGAVQALREVSVDCRAGEIHALVGENGSGKSTLLGIASGFLTPDAGTVVVGETERRRVSPAESRRLGLGIAYQTYSHVLHLSVAENLYLAAPSDLRPTYGRMNGWAADRLAAAEQTGFERGYEAGHQDGYEEKRCRLEPHGPHGLRKCYDHEKYEKTEPDRGKYPLQNEGALRGESTHRSAKPQFCGRVRGQDAKRTLRFR